MLHVTSARCVACDLHRIAPWPLERMCWGQFVVQWGDRKKSEIAPLNAIIYISLINYCWTLHLHGSLWRVGFHVKRAIKIVRSLSFSCPLSARIKFLSVKHWLKQQRLTLKRNVYLTNVTKYLYFFCCDHSATSVARNLSLFLWKLSVTFSFRCIIISNVLVDNKKLQC